MPCRHFLSQLRETHPKISDLGADVVAVGTGSHKQALALMQQGTPFPCLVDPEKNLYRALAIERIPLRNFLRASTWARYLPSITRARQGRITGDPLQAPGVVILDPDLNVRYAHRGTTLGDYPPLDEVLATLERP